MGQETTKEFSARLRMAIDAHPLAPDTPFGRQAWLRDRLEKEAGISVSANAIHKWVNDAARPREDNIRALARILQVDEVWLSLGRTPNSDLGQNRQSQGSPTGVSSEALILAGLLQAKGSNVVFAPKDDVATLYRDAGSGSVGVVVVECEDRAGSLLAVVPEPVGGNTVVAVLTGPCEDASAGVNVYDLTDAPRRSFGGYSILSMTRRKDGRLKIDGERSLIKPMPSMAELV
jgi:transcriptional regulator with XRE-family HTH domain